MIPRATYRLQFHRDFTFADAERLVPYLDALGISHVYASPITVAVPGSRHGYDVVDPTRINPELGGEDAFRSLAAALRARAMGMVIDIVPNHMGVAGAANPWWNDVLARGRASEYASFFDMDWNRGPIVLPVLGTPLQQALDAGDIAVERHDGRWQVVAYGEHRFPIRAEDGDDPDRECLAALLNRQHYRLVWWRTANDVLNWRRFFAINDLAGIRAEDPEVFGATHALYLRLYGEGLIDGVRVDHVDGLTDPAGYCRRLRDALDAQPRPAGASPGPAWIVVEKILAEGETLPRDWPIDGTSGYDAMEDLSALLHDPAGANRLGALWQEVSGRPADFAPEELLARQQILAWEFSGQLEACLDAICALAAATPAADGISRGMWRRAVERLLWVFPVYRTYGTGTDAPATDAATLATARERVAGHIPPGEAFVTDLLLAWLGGGAQADPVLAAEAVRRFQQLSAPIAAKAVEDTAFYRYGRLISRNDVGADAGRLSLDPQAFLARAAARAGDWPHAMLTTATHDHKRGEDTRARLAVLSAMPDRWREQVRRWERIANTHGNDVDRGDRYMLFQALLGAWPTGDVPDDFADRIAAWQTKALREAKLRSSWASPDEAYEARAEALARALIADSDFVAAMQAFLAEIGPAAAANSLVQTGLRYTLPGVPDLYQGAELEDLSLVDPDNRRPVDFDVRAALLDRPPPKLRLIVELLRLRRDHPALFRDGALVPAAVSASAAGDIVAFTRVFRDEQLDCAFALHGRASWAEEELRFAGAEPVTADAIFAHRPVWWRLRRTATKE